MDDFTCDEQCDDQSYADWLDMQRYYDSEDLLLSLDDFEYDEYPEQEIEDLPF